jgi:hypothetical protein
LAQALGVPAERFAKGVAMNRKLVVGGFALLGVGWFVLLGLVLPLMAKVQELDRRLHEVEKKQLITEVPGGAE